ncbi:hypothetical protein [Modestobacter sp. URMC 112]
MTDRRGGPLATALAEVDRDAAQEGVDRRLARWVLVAPLIGAVLAAATLVHRPLFLWVMAEDRVVEWAQFAAFAAAGVLFAVAAFRLARSGELVAAVLIAFGALGILGIAGEEISWGQRLLGLETPESLAEANHQNEINIHNITTFPVQRIGNYLQLVLGFAGMLLPWLTRVRRPVVSARLLRLLSPPLMATTCFGLLFAYRAVRFVYDSTGQAVVKYGEWPELCFALALALFAFLLARGARDGRAFGEAAPRGQGAADAPTAPGTTAPA